MYITRRKALVLTALDACVYGLIGVMIGHWFW